VSRRRLTAAASRPRTAIASLVRRAVPPAVGTGGVVAYLVSPSPWMAARGTVAVAAAIALWAAVARRRS
jgi:hypothetical protein